MTNLTDSTGTTSSPSRAKGRRPVTPLQAGQQATTGVRARIEATTDGYPDLATLTAVLTDLSHLTELLPHALDQANQWVTHAHTAGPFGVAAPAGPTAGERVAYTALQLTQAAKYTAWAGDALGQARQETTHLTTLGSDLADGADGAAGVDGVVDR